jgi:hypothetical protein
MATYEVVEVRKELSADVTHRHIEGVCTSVGRHYTRAEGVTSIDAGDTWKTSADGYEATIAKMKSARTRTVRRRTTSRASIHADGA